MTQADISDWNPMYGSKNERERHYERQTERVTRWEKMIDRKMAAKRPSIRHSTDSPTLWGKK